MQGKIICLSARIKGSTTICNRRLPEAAFEWIQTYFVPFVIYRHRSPLSSEFF
jgi:hypothetical protein